MSEVFSAFRAQLVRARTAFCAFAAIGALIAIGALTSSGCSRKEAATTTLAAAAPVEPTVAPAAPAESAVPAAVQEHQALAALPGLPPGHPATSGHAHVHGAAAEPPRAAGDVVAHGPTGVVREVLAGDGSTLLRIETDAGDRWAAITGEAPALGSRVAIVEAVRLVRHHSKALDRTFEELWLGRLANDFNSLRADVPASYPQAIAPEVAIDAVRRDRAQLGGTSVVVRGVVAKVTRRVLGKDWVHLRDASTGAEGAALVVTTTDAVEPGQIVTARGRLAVDAEIGAGYRYDVLLQDAKVQQAGAPEVK